MVLNLEDVGEPAIEDTLYVLVLNGHPGFEEGPQSLAVFLMLVEKAAR